MKQDNVQEFIELYNVFDDLLRQKYNETNRTISMISRYIRQLENSSSTLAHKKARKINMIRVLRNNLVHEFDFNAEDLIDVSEETITFLKEEIEDLKNPITAFTIATKTKDLLTVDLDENVRDVLLKMQEKGFTQAPLLSDTKKVEGVFSPNVLFSYLAKNNIHNGDKLYIKDFVDYLPIEKHISEQYAFIEKDALIEDVMELFDEAHRKNKKLVAIFVTEYGKKEQTILGMIVPYDLLKTRKYNY